jgi:AcrR family transcriptional regulator
MCENLRRGKNTDMQSARKRTPTAKLSRKSKPDRRLAKTRANLSQALFLLIQQREWDDIAVLDICTTADVARSSFYAHFDSKTALLDHMILRSLAASREVRVQQAGSLGLVAWIIDHVTENRSMFYRVAQSGGAQIILNRFKAALCAELAEEFRLEGATRPEVRANFTLGGTFDALVVWSRTWKVSDLPTVRTHILTMSASANGLR